MPLQFDSMLGLIYRRTGRRRLAAPLAALFFLCLAAPVAAFAQHTAPTYANPVAAGDFPDPSVIRVGGDFWAAATTGTWAPHFALLHSRDLVNWRPAGYVFRERPRWAKSDFWAPEIVADRGRFFVYYTARRDEGPERTGTLCVAVATAPRPQGPYTDRGPLACEIPELANVGSIDAAFVRDERGRPYLVWKADGNDAEPDQPTSIFAQRLSDDGTRLLGRRVEIMRNDAPWERHVVEGSYFVRRNGWFYHFYSGNACCGRDCDYALGVARAKKLLGPWEKSPRNPILDDNESWQCPGHGSIVTLADGRDYLLYHSYRRRPDTFNVGRETLLDEVRYDAPDGWPTINRGRGPSNTAPAPLGVAETDDNDGAAFFDDFNSPALNPAWQWPMSNRQSARVDLHGGASRLLLQALPGGARDSWTGAVLGRRTTSGDYVATAVVDVRGIAPSMRAGLAVLNARENAVGVSVGGGRVIVWARRNEQERVLATAAAPRGDAVHLRLTAHGGERFCFAFGADGRAWTNLGECAAGGYVEGARVGLVVGNAGGGAFAAGKFDRVRIEPRVAKEGN